MLTDAVDAAVILRFSQVIEPQRLKAWLLNCSASSINMEADIFTESIFIHTERLQEYGGLSSGPEGGSDVTTNNHRRRRRKLASRMRLSCYGHVTGTHISMLLSGLYSSIRVTINDEICSQTKLTCVFIVDKTWVRCETEIIFLCGGSKKRKVSDIWHQNRHIRKNQKTKLKVSFKFKLPYLNGKNYDFKSNLVINLCKKFFI